MRISFITKVTSVLKPATAANDISYVPPFWLCSLNFIPVDRVEISHMKTIKFIPVTEPARLPGSYEGVSNGLCEHASSAYIFASTSSDQFCHASSEHFRNNK